MNKKQLKKEVEQQEVQLAGCSTAALGWNQDPAKPGDYGWSVSYQDVLDLRNKYDSLIKNQIPFSTYYAERLEYWKGKFDKKPDKSCIIILFKDKTIKVIDYNDTEKMDEDYENIEKDLSVFEIQSIRCNGFATSKELVKAAQKCPAVHPVPYTPEEIKAWAREQLEKEMQGWKVVKEENAEQGWPWKEICDPPIIGSYTATSQNEQDNKMVEEELKAAQEKQFDQKLKEYWEWKARQQRNIYLTS